MSPADLLQALPEILAAWRSRLRPGADVLPRRDERGRAEVALAASLVRVGLAGPEEDESGAALIAVTVAVATYGRMQYAQYLDPAAILRELAFLRDAIWRAIERTATPTDTGSLSFISRVDGAIDIAARAAIRAGAERGSSASRPASPFRRS